jgi:hypothetical protein
MTASIGCSPRLERVQLPRILPRGISQVRSGCDGLQRTTKSDLAGTIKWRKNQRELQFYSVVLVFYFFSLHSMWFVSKALTHSTYIVSGIDIEETLLDQVLDHLYVSACCCLMQQAALGLRK